MTRFLVTIAFCCLALGCGSPGAMYQRAGTPALKLDVRRASTVEVEGWKSINDGQRDLFVAPETELENEDVVSSGAKQDEAGYWLILLTLNDAGKQKFAKLSDGLVDPEDVAGKRMVFLVDGQIVSAPVVREPIIGGVVQIPGQFSEQEARRLAKGIVGPP